MLKAGTEDLLPYSPLISWNADYHDAFYEMPQEDQEDAESYSTNSTNSSEIPPKGDQRDTCDCNSKVIKFMQGLNQILLEKMI